MEKSLISLLLLCGRIYFNWKFLNIDSYYEDTVSYHYLAMYNMKTLEDIMAVNNCNNGPCVYIY
jgi:hypothetical protein